ncbi:hypothetical protein NPIL_140351 [Nephila pilipes]|uniref:Uncharacterized protein n=1 Tax=Nephila pilipes TaxID=299642 RepID=A0A8X6TUT4_NEPPI|nr:hypothetical protein NPIL_140351 [Nephila pilipes]
MYTTAIVRKKLLLPLEQFDYDDFSDGNYYVILAQPGIPLRSLIPTMKPKQIIHKKNFQILQTLGYFRVFKSYVCCISRDDNDVIDFFPRIKENNFLNFVILSLMSEYQHYDAMFDGFWDRSGL